MKCLKCKKEMLLSVYDKDGNRLGMAPGEQEKIFHDGENDYILCQHCNAKNILEVDTLSESPAMGYIITRYED